MAEQLYRERRLRDATLSLPLFGEPAWDILLDLYVNESRAKTVSISSACFAGFAAPTTGLRYVVRLEELGFIARRPDPLDRRRQFLELTEKGAAQMTAYLDRIAAARAAGEGS